MAASRQVSRPWIGCGSGQLPSENEESPIFVKIGLIVRPTTIHIIQVETRGAEINQCVGIVLPLQAAGGIKGEIMINELTEVGIERRYPAFFGIGAYITALALISARTGFLVAVLLAIVGTTLLASLLGLASLHFKGDRFVLGTLAFQVLITAVLFNWISVTQGPFGITAIPRPRSMTSSRKTARLELCSF